MWIPKSAADVEQAAVDDTIEEGPLLDAKQVLPAKGKNADLAVDIAAMANDGGVLLYGIGEDAMTRRPTVLAPFALKGQRERIAQIVSSGLDEPPTISVHALSKADDPDNGYIVVVVPPSPRAPHMVTVGGEHRFYGRTATGNKILTQGEVARLYERRQKWSVDRVALLNEAIDHTTRAFGAPSAELASLYIVLRPVVPDNRFLEHAIPDRDPQPSNALRSLVIASQATFPNSGGFDIMPGQGWYPRGTGMRSGTYLPTTPQPSADLIDLEIHDDGSAYLFCRRIGDVHTDGRFRLYLQPIAQLTARACAVLGGLYREGGYAGPVDIGVAVTGLSGKDVFTDDYMTPGVLFTSDYRATTGVLAFQLSEDPIRVAQDLVMGLIRALARDYDPFPPQRTAP